MEETQQSSSPDLANARHQAKAVLKSAQITSAPVVLNEVLPAVRNKFSLIIKSVPDSLFSGKADAITQVRGDQVVILYNDARSVTRQRFSVAHEIGHLYRGHLHGNSSIDLNSENFDEIEANTFAAYLLMPPEFLRADIKSGLKPKDLASKYKVSEDAMWVQLTAAGLINLF